jgi:glucose-1-phosphate adenylyltransferase
MRRVAAMILAGGRADSLLALSRVRAKASVPFGGQYRLIDFPLSNCTHSGLTNVGILTQYLPESLKAHVGIGKPWDLDRRDGGVRLLEPYYTGGESQWYRGRADALAQNLEVLDDEGFDHVLVLAAEHVYKMDYRPLLDFHASAGAGVTVVGKDLPVAHARRYGVIKTGRGHAVASYGEEPPAEGTAFASLSIYVFSRPFLIALLHDMVGRGGSAIAEDLVVPAIEQNAAAAYRLDDYWARVDAVDDYYDVTFEFLAEEPPFAFDDPAWPLYTHLHDDPPVKLGPAADVKNSLVADGSIINGRVENSVLFRRVYVERDAVVTDSILLEGTTVEAEASVDRAVLDKLVRVGAGARVGEDVGEPRPNADFPEQLSRGLTLVGKRVKIPPGFRLGRNCLLDLGVRESDLAAVPDRTMANGTSAGVSA